jgi:hypothetical protein
MGVPRRGCGAGGAGCSARHRRAGREQGAGGRRSIGGRGTLGGRSDPAFSDGVGVGRPNRRADDLDTGQAPDIVERPGELGVPVRIRNLNTAARSPRSRRRLRACWATHGPVGWAVTPAKCTRRLSSWMTNSTYSRRRSTVSTVKKSQARMPAACRRRNHRQMVGARRGAGSMP